MTCPKKIIQSIQQGLANKQNGRWSVLFAVVFNDGTEGYILRTESQLSNLVDSGGRAKPIDGLHYHPPELLFSKTCPDCQE